MPPTSIRSFFSDTTCRHFMWLCFAPTISTLWLLCVPKITWFRLITLSSWGIWFVNSAVKTRCMAIHYVWSWTIISLLDNEVLSQTAKCPDHVCHIKLFLNTLCDRLYMYIVLFRKSNLLANSKLRSNQRASLPGRRSPWKISALCYCPAHYKWDTLSNQSSNYSVTLIVGNNCSARQSKD